MSQFYGSLAAKSRWPEDYGVHPLHCADVLDGSYDIPWSPVTPPVILDLGANIGAFTKWAYSRWPGCTIYAYEPQPNNFNLLTRTVESLPDRSRIHVFQNAVSDEAGSMNLKLHAGAMNCGEWSLYTGGDSKDSVAVNVVAASELPRADILKIDTEGAEAKILDALKYRLHEFSALVLEIHNSAWVTPIDDLLKIAGFACVKSEKKFNSENRVEAKYLKSNLLKHGS